MDRISSMRLPIRLIPVKTDFNFIKYKSLAFFLSILISIAAIGFVTFKGLNLGIDFSGGIIFEVRLQGSSDSDDAIADLRKALTKHGYGNAIIQNSGKPEDVMIRLQSQNNTNQVEEISRIKEILTSEFSHTVEFRKIDYVGPKVGKELIKNGMQALVVSIICMLIYIWSRFDWQFGIGAVVSLAHDAIVTLGFYSISGYDFDLTSVAAVLTIIGYSINDTVVIYDRVRENLTKYQNDTIKNIVNISINETLSRTIMTVATTLLVCLSLVLVGGEVLRGFSMALLFGIAFGTYSSIYIAAPILIHTSLKVSEKTS